jgi:hypothetical protein
MVEKEEPPNYRGANCCFNCVHMNSYVYYEHLYCDKYKQIIESNSICDDWC